MRFYTLNVLLCIAIVTHSQNKGINKTDLDAINSLANNWAKYWNEHNADSMATLLTEDVDFINVAGVWTRNKEELIKQTRERHEGMFKNAVWKSDSVSIKYVKPDLAIVHVGWSLKGDLNPDGSPRQPRSGLFTWVVVKQKNKWLILSAHNVNIRSTSQ